MPADILLLNQVLADPGVDLANQPMPARLELFGNVVVLPVVRIERRELAPDLVATLRGRARRADQRRQAAYMRRRRGVEQCEK